MRPCSRAFLVTVLLGFLLSLTGCAGRLQGRYEADHASLWPGTPQVLDFDTDGSYVAHTAMSQLGVTAPTAGLYKVKGSRVMLFRQSNSRVVAAEGLLEGNAIRMSWGPNALTFRKAD